MCNGLVLVGSPGIFFDSSGSLSQPAEEHALGIALVFGKIFMGVLKDLLVEVFLQESQFPALLLVGMEGGYVLLICVPRSGRILPNDLRKCVLDCLHHLDHYGHPAVTSSMTRNMWRNFCGLVWVVGLMVFHATSSTKSQESGIEDIELGEEFLVPGSFMILIGFLVSNV